MGRMPPPAPNAQQLLIISVPHSGTRTLARHLGARAQQHFRPIERNQHYGGKGNAVHIPIRHPLSVAESWARRGKPIDILVSSYESMFDYLDKKEEDRTLHKIEDLPRLAGLNDRDRRDGELGRVNEYQDIIRDRVLNPHAEFFSRFYGRGEGGVA